MALAITPGSGATIATELISGQHYNYTKLTDASLGGSATVGMIVDSGANASGAAHVFLRGNVTINPVDPKIFVGLVTIGGIGTVTLADPKGFIGLVSVTGSINDGLMPIGTALNTYSVHVTTNTTNTPTSSTAYISCIAISSEVAGTTSTVTIQDKQGTPLKLVNGFSTSALTTTPTTLTFNSPIKMVSGIDIITAGAVAATVDVWVNYYQ